MSSRILLRIIYRRSHFDFCAAGLAVAMLAHGHFTSPALIHGLDINYSTPAAGDIGDTGVWLRAVTWLNRL